tara:strand:- start:1986 stop:2582 length:597 start_codon:yes stop_codon:yes gene_type:complete
MIEPKDLNQYIDLYQDFLHPNPNINSQAIYLLRKDFKVKFMKNLLDNLKEDDLVLRRKSILALGEFGEEILIHIAPIYLNSKNTIVKASCLKIIIKVIVNFNLKKLDKDLMSIVEAALVNSSPEIILSAVSLLRQLGLNGRDILLKTSRDKDLLIAKASVSALLEMKDQVVEDSFDQLLSDKSIDPMIKEDILRDRLV